MGMKKKIHIKFENTIPTRNNVQAQILVFHLYDVSHAQIIVEYYNFMYALSVTFICHYNLFYELIVIVTTFVILINKLIYTLTPIA